MLYVNKIVLSTNQNPNPLKQFKLTKAICYISTAISDLTELQFDELFGYIMKRNKSLGLTGVLIVQNNHFFQILEGDEGVIDDIYAKICKDKRHYGIIKLLEQKTTTPIFEDYDVGFTVVKEYDQLNSLHTYLQWIKAANLKEIDSIYNLTMSYLNKARHDKT